MASTMLPRNPLILHCLFATEGGFETPIHRPASTSVPRHSKRPRTQAGRATYVPQTYESFLTRLIVQPNALVCAFATGAPLSTASTAVLKSCEWMRAGF